MVKEFIVDRSKDLNYHIKHHIIFKTQHYVTPVLTLNLA